MIKILLLHYHWLFIFKKLRNFIRNISMSNWLEILVARSSFSEFKFFLIGSFGDL